METLNQALFLFINASSDAHPFVVWTADVFAVYAIWLAPLTLIAGWLRGDMLLRHYMVEAAMSTGLALLAAQIIGVAWPHPRPFMIGIGTNLMAHSPDSSFPSDHLTCLWGAAFSLLMHGRTRRIGSALAILGVPMAWSRIYLGVHFPMDIVGASMVSGASAWVLATTGQHPVEFMVGIASYVYRQVIRTLIRRS
ncbi:undecaprenyl-diphosphatase [Caballeronia sordidicola]|uniref:Bacitracin transport permease protein BCRC n=1 Tax=Caballeronia sordidicola TaxID=196367 RepID=A0A242MNL1_CABSO|nr:undecaprenyl-diphosphatase [Caballeronia sordidicola]OTP72909.1 Bacitracin transport permease protein BCRC [Caballeronia sordidicola]